MVRFSRFRTRSRSIASARQSNSDDEETSTPLFPRARSSTKTSFIDLKRLQSKERKLTDEDIELRDLLKKINANVDGDDETDLTTTVGLLKQRTSSTTSSSQGNGDRNSRESLAQESLLTKKQPLWKRRLSRVTLGTGQSQKQKRAAKKQAEIEKQSLERNQDGEDRQGVSLIEANEDKMVQKRIQSKDFSIGKRQSSKLDTVDDEEDDIAGPIGMPSVIYSVVKAQPSEDKEDYSVKSPSVAYSSASSAPSETSERSGIVVPKYGHASRYGGHSSVGDSISSLGRDDEHFHDDSHCSVSLLASDAIRSAAVMILQCNDRCNDDFEDLHEHRRSSRRSRRGRD